MCRFKTVNFALYMNKMKLALSLGGNLKDDYLKTSDTKNRTLNIKSGYKLVIEKSKTISRIKFARILDSYKQSINRSPV